MHFFLKKVELVDDLFSCRPQTQAANAAHCFAVKKTNKAVRYGYRSKAICRARAFLIHGSGQGEASAVDLPARSCRDLAPPGVAPPLPVRARLRRSPQ